MKPNLPGRATHYRGVYGSTLCGRAGTLRTTDERARVDCHQCRRMLGQRVRNCLSTCEPDCTVRHGPVRPHGSSALCTVATGARKASYPRNCDHF